MGKAAIFKKYPFTIILKEEIVEPKNQELRIKIDPGARTTVRFVGYKLLAAMLQED